MKGIIEQSNIVFNNNEEVNLCGRENCIKLMEMLEEKFPGINFGNKNTGFMNLETIVPIIKMIRGKLSKNTQEQYNKVFYKNKEQKLCGRENCIKLIEMLKEEFPGVDFGNIKTGFMNLDTMNYIGA